MQAQLSLKFPIWRLFGLLFSFFPLVRKETDGGEQPHLCLLKKQRSAFAPPTPKHVSQDFSKTTQDIENMTETKTTRIPA